MHERLEFARDYLSESSLPLLAVQLLGFLALLVGISFWSIPAALVVGGILAIAACEMQSRGPDRKAVEAELAAENEQTRLQVDACLKDGKNPFKAGICPTTSLWVQYVDTVTRSVPAPTASH